MQNNIFRSQAIKCFSDRLLAVTENQSPENNRKEWFVHHHGFWVFFKSGISQGANAILMFFSYPL